MASKRLTGATLLAGTLIAANAWSWGISAAVSKGGYGAIFDVKQRMQLLQTKPYSAAKKACLSIPKKEAGKLPDPIDGLRGTEGYGSDKRTQKLSWHVMILSSHALAGDAHAKQELRAALTAWAKADALMNSEEVHDSYYALKRLLMPLIVGYSIVSADNPNAAENRILRDWLDPLVRKVDKKFDGDVDINNHRYLADSVLISWGRMIGDKTLYNKGIERFRIALADARPDGSLPLETRRGARATWYMRHALSSLVVMAEAAHLQGDDLYSLNIDGTSLDDIMGYFISAVYNPLVILPYAAENYIPGPGKNYMQQDMGMMHTRPHGRHYMAFAEGYLAHQTPSFQTARLQNLINFVSNIGDKNRTIAAERPLIDEYVGGNASCFWWVPEDLK